MAELDYTLFVFKDFQRNATEEAENASNHGSHYFRRRHLHTDNQGRNRKDCRTHYRKSNLRPELPPTHDYATLAVGRT